MKQTGSESSLCKDSFLSILKSYPETGKYWIAYSGGMDSSVLLHLFYSIKEKLNQELEVIYVDHGLNPKSHKWGEFCKNQCLKYKIKFSLIKLDENCPKGVSIEEWARERRYLLLAEKMNDDDILFTAHHQDDQVETFFLQALRGAGPRGLVAMPSIKKFIKGLHARPLLKFRRNEIQYYANNNKLNWNNDDSNADMRYDRNYLRNKVLPEFETRWPAYRETINRLINHQKEYKELLDQLAQEDLEKSIHHDSDSLKLDVVRSLSIERQKNLIFVWLDSLGLNCPGSKHMEKIILELVNLDTDKSPCVNWGDVEVRRYKDFIYASKALISNDANNEYTWDIEKPLILFNEILQAFPDKGKGISKRNIDNATVVVRYRKGGEKIYPEHLSHSRTVKQLFQEKSVLPWYRDRFPLVYINNDLAVIPGFCVDKKFAAEKNESSWDIKWTGYDKAVQK